MPPPGQFAGRQLGNIPQRPIPIPRNFTEANVPVSELEFFRNQVHPEGRGHRIRNENMAVRALREDKQKQLVKAAKAKETRRNQMSSLQQGPTPTNQSTTQAPVTPSQTRTTHQAARDTSLPLSTSSATVTSWASGGLHTAHQPHGFEFNQIPPGTPAPQPFFHRNESGIQLTNTQMEQTPQIGGQAIANSAVTQAAPTSTQAMQGDFGNSFYMGTDFSGRNNGNTSELTQDEDVNDFSYMDEPWINQTLQQDEFEVDDTDSAGADPNPTQAGGYGFQVSERPVTLKRKHTDMLPRRNMASTSSRNVRSRTATPNPGEAISDRTGGDWSLSDDDDSASKSEATTASGRPSRSCKSLGDKRKKVFEATAELYRKYIAKEDAFPEIGADDAESDLPVDKLTEIVTALWFKACNNLEFDLMDPSDFEIQRIRDRGSTYRGKIRDVAAGLVVENFGIIDTRKMKGATAATRDEALNHNRKLIEDLDEKNTFWYTDPSDISVPNSMYRNDIIQQVLTNAWFAESGMHSKAFYFRGDLQIPLETIALILSVVRCALKEWTEGKFHRVPFEGDKFESGYRGFVTRLRSWKQFSATQPQDLTMKLQQELLSNARLVAGVVDKDNSTNDDESVEAQFALFAQNQG